MLNKLQKISGGCAPGPLQLLPRTPAVAPSVTLRATTLAEPATQHARINYHHVSFPPWLLQNHTEAFKASILVVCQPNVIILSSHGYLGLDLANSEIIVTK